MKDISEIKALLASDAFRVAAYLMPGGKRDGREWRIGSLEGEQGRSLGVCIEGQKAGVWSDFASGESGDLLDLWCRVRGCTLAEALSQAADWLGISAPKLTIAKKTHTRPRKPSCSSPKASVLSYLQSRRKMPPDAIAAYKIGESGNNIIFPFLDPAGELIMVKSREAVDGAKPKPMESGYQKILFGWQAIQDLEQRREITICEGEIDALSLYAYGFPALSVPFGGGGGGKQDWIENEFDRLAQFEVINLALDNDPIGQEAVVELIARLGRHRCKVVVPPGGRKDWNQCLMEDVSNEEVHASFRAGKYQHPEELRNGADYFESVAKLMHPAGGREEGLRLPWSKAKDNVIFRPGELSIWTGESGCGKSQVLGHVCAASLHQGYRWCLASLEMSPDRLLMRMARQLSGIANPSPAYLEAIHNVYAGKLWLYDLVGKVKIERLLESFEYARRRFGVNHFIVDSLMRLGMATDDYNSHEKAVFELVNFAIAGNVHVHLVIHSRKADTSNKPGPPGTQDIKGAVEIGAQAFNVIGVWRNRGREETLDRLESRHAAGEDVPELEAERAKPGVLLNVGKQRNGNWEGKIGLWFDKKSYQYLEGPNHSPLRYVKFSNQNGVDGNE